MARTCNLVSGQYLSRTSAVVSAYPVTFACWANLDDTTNYHVLCALSSSSAAVSCGLWAYGAESDEIAAFVTNGVANGTARTSAAYTASTWFHACAVFSSNTSRAAYLNGANKGTDTTSVTIPSVDRTAVGTRFSIDVAGFTANGKLAEAAIWDVALTDDDVASLAKGYSPLLIRPEGLIAYWPIIGRYSPEIDKVGGFDLTVNGSAPVADHTRVFYYHSHAIFDEEESSSSSSLSSSSSTLSSSSSSTLSSSSSSTLSSSSSSSTSSSISSSSSSTLSSSSSSTLSSSSSSSLSSSSSSSFAIAKVTQDMRGNFGDLNGNFTN